MLLPLTRCNAERHKKSKRNFYYANGHRVVLAYVSPNVLQVDVIIRRFSFLVLILATK